MGHTNSQEDLIKRYLLGELSTAEQVALEDEYFIDRSKYDQICRAEDELLDLYARGSLSEADRVRFERAYLANPSRRQHAKFARAFVQMIANEPIVPQSTGSELIEGLDANLPWWSQLTRLLRGPRFAPSMIVISATALIGFGVIWMVKETSRLRDQLTEARREAEMQQQRAQSQAEQIATLEKQYRQLTQERAQITAQLKEAQATAMHASRQTVLFTLPISAFRDSGSQESRTLVIPRPAEEVRVRLNLLEHAFPGYQVMLLTTDGREVFAIKGISPKATRTGDALFVNIPARNFANRENVISLGGVNDSGEIETLGKTIVKIRKK